MKIQCDVCSGDEASVFCCADEAALCDACDRRVHHANKLASKHRRFSLSSAEQTQLLLCDICKERRGFVFCQEDRAILCRDCDEPIHSANQLSMKHSRFLLTGSRLSATPLSSTLPLQDAIEFDNNSNSNSSKATVEKSNQNKSMAVKESSVIITPTSTPAPSNGSSSSISEYLIKTIPGYCVEDLLVDEANGLFKSGEAVPFSEPELAAAAAAEEFPIWVPDQVQSLNFLQTSFSGSVQCSIGFGLKELNQNQQYYHHGLKVSREQLSDESFMVPEINTPVSSANKRPRPSSAWDF